MKPILYSETETQFDTNGNGILSDAVTCFVETELNGIYELEMTYQVAGIHFSDIQQRRIILAKPDPISKSQPFRIYRITKPMGGMVKVYARHVAYDLMGIPVAPFSADYVGAALKGMRDNAVTDCPFTFKTDKLTEGKMTVSVPKSIWSLLGGSEGSILDIYGGEYDFDRWDITLYKNRGANRGVSIRYGKNLTSLEQDENCAGCYTGVYPYWTNADGTLVQLDEKIVNADGNFGYVRILPLDLSEEWESAPDMDQLRARAQRYIKDNEIGIPTVSWEVGFVQLEQTEEYKDRAVLEQISLGDTVSVIFTQLGVNASARAVKTRYNVIMDRYESVTLGSVRANIADTIAKQQKEIKEKVSNSAMQAAVSAATEWLTNGKGYKVERRDANGNTIDTLYMDTPDIKTAKNVMRVGNSGIGFSYTGVDGPYISAWTIDGKFNADFILAGTLYGILIKAGKITSEDEKIVIDLSKDADEPIFNSGISTNGLNIRGDAAGANSIFKVQAEKMQNSDSYYADVNMYSVDGSRMLRITENFDESLNPTGCSMEVFAKDGLSSILLAAANNIVGLWISSADERTPVIGLYNNANSFLNAEILNGKKMSWEYSSELDAYVLTGTDI